MAVQTDLINTGQLVETPEGLQLTMDYLVSDVAGDQYSRRSNALLASEIPPMGFQPPGLPSLRVVERTVSPVDDSPSKFVVRVRFEVPSASEADLDRSLPYGPTTWSGAGRNATEETIRDYRGNIMRVYYSGFPVIESVDINTGEVSERVLSTGTYRIAEVAKVSRDKGLLRLNADRWERDDPESTARGFHNKVNAQQWRDYPPKTVISNEMSFQPDPLGGWNVSYSFTYDEEGWQYLNAVTVFKQVPHDAEIGNGIEYHDIYEPVAFDQWRL